VELQFQRLPIVGKLLSGTYTVVPADTSNNDAAVVVAPPKDLIGTGKKLLLGGQLELDVSGLISTHVDVDVAADEAGTATLKVSSPLIPKLPFENSASSSSSYNKKGGKEGDWFAVTNLGDGSTYYWNQATETTQYEKPTDL